MAREQFYWDNPGIPYSTNGGNESTIPVGGRDADGNVIQPPPETFLLMLLYPTNVDYLRLGDNYRQLDEWDESDDKCHWSSLRTNPQDVSREEVVEQEEQLWSGEVSVMVYMTKLTEFKFLTVALRLWFCKCVGP